MIIMIPSEETKKKKKKKSKPCEKLVRKTNRKIGQEIINSVLLTGDLLLAKHHPQF